jgi:hypothetical protein
MSQPPQDPGAAVPAPQPYPGLPNPDVPASVPASYPSYLPPPPPEDAPLPAGEAGYGDQPVYGPLGIFDSGQPPAPERSSTAVPIVVAAMLVVVVLGAGIGLFLLVLNRRSAEPAGTAAPAPAAVTVTAPETLGGRPRLTDPQFANMATALQDTLRNLPGATASIGGVYGTPDKQDVVVVTAAQVPSSDPATDLDRAFFGAGVGGLAISEVAAVDSGLGGVAKCGAAKSLVLDLAFCSWADEGSLGMVMWYSQPVGLAKAEFSRLRAEIETKR